MRNTLVARQLAIVVGKPNSTRPVTIGTKKQPGFCIKCAAIATTEALFREDGVVIIERYCDKCLPSAKR